MKLFCIQKSFPYNERRNQQIKRIARMIFPSRFTRKGSQHYISAPSSVEDLTKTMQGVSDTIGFYLGTCGNYGWNIPKWCASNGY